ncbi:MAG: mannose-6-phosphate isomerase [Cytophagales bacterium]|nr:MAG: mannose-6-phosphate isomerase [Cytophagales bacterium]
MTASGLYPLKFKTIFKDKIWGGNKIKTYLGKDYAPLPNCGETWEISGVKGNLSVVSSGTLSGKSLPQLIEEYKSQLLGEKVYSQFGSEFPLLIKYIDANDDLSIQVHPDDELAKKRHNSFGKTEMWYIMQADEGAQLNTGFNQPINEAIYLEHLNKNTLNEILNFETVNSGDVFFLPAGRVHYIGKGICLAEIQQTSDITYRIYDFDRKDDQGNKRELHTQEALAAIDYQYYDDYKTQYTPSPNKSAPLVSCPYFTTNLLEIDQTINKDYASIDSFVIFIAIEGKTTIEYENGTPITFSKGDCILLPANLYNIQLTPESNSKILEVYIS